MQAFAWLVPVLVALLGAQAHPVQISPFDELRWVGGEPEVRVDTTWYRPVTIDGVAVSDVLAVCDREWPGMREKRFGEDVAEALHRMGTTMGSEVRLELVRLADGEPVTLERVPATEAKRNAIRDAKRIPIVTAPRSPPRIGREAAREDLREFRARLEDQFAYLRLRAVDLDAELARIDGALGAEVEVAWLARELRVLLMRCGDAHAGVRSDHEPRAPPAPFCVAKVGGGFVAFLPDRTAFVDPARPYLIALDGRPLADWLAAVRPEIADGSPQLVRARSLEALAELDRARRALGLPEGGPVTLTVARDAAGQASTDVKLELAVARGTPPPPPSTWPSTRSRLLGGTSARSIPGGVGYLRIPRMDDDKVPELRASMREFRETGGLIVDVRGNGGGSRGHLLALAGYLLAPDAAPLVVNVAAYRLSARFPEDHLGGSRHLFRADDPRWTEPQRAAIAAFAPGFTPEWALPDGFSAWHYLVLDRTGHADEYAYPSPVVVLCDEHGFSATDVFLAGLAELPGVTLVGLPSGGGSARAEEFSLTFSAIDVRCASMASFRADGRLFDGRGVEVDVVVERGTTDVLAGGGDAQLEAALDVLERLRGR